MAKIIIDAVLFDDEGFMLNLKGEFMKTIQVWDRLTAEHYVAGRIKVPFMYISFSDKEEDAVVTALDLDGYNVAFIRKFFVDLTSESALEQLPRGVGYRVCNMSDAYDIVSMVIKHWDQVELVIVQCDQGISRSSATAKAVAEFMNGCDGKAYGPPKYHPNSLVYNLMCRAFKEKL